MDKRQIAREHLERLDLDPMLIEDMFTLSVDDPELSAYYGYPKAQADILCERLLSRKAIKASVVIDETTY